LPTIRLLFLLLLICAHALAQKPASNRMRSEAPDESSLAGGGDPEPAVPVSLPDAPASQRVIDKKFIAVMSALGGAESLRFTSRKMVLDREFAAGAPWVTSVPANQHLVAKYAGLYAAEWLVAYEFKKPHSWLPGDKVIRKLRWVYPAAMVAIHIKNGVGNIRTQGPGGCTSVECAEQMQ
jgi:hypothetical protein